MEQEVMQAIRAELESFVPMINSWEICDSSCATCHFMKKDQEYWYGYLQKWLKSSREYEKDSLRWLLRKMLKTWKR